MNSFSHINNIYFLGIGGIGMSALARYFNALGKRVAGTDRHISELTRTLEAEGIQVSYSAEVDLIPEEIRSDKDSLIVYTPAISGSNPQYQYFLNHGYTIKKRAQVLGDITRGSLTLAVAGTHGKTTTTAILAHLLKHAGAKVSAFLGGISENYQSNLILAGNEVIVVEADEYDRSFLQLSPNIAAIISMDADHLDIYGEAKELEDSFTAFAQLVPEDGKLFHKKGLPLSGISIAVEEEADISVRNIRIDNGSYIFDLNYQGELLEDLQLSLPGKHNLFNAATALSMALAYGIPQEALKAALADFRGVQRRFSYKIRREDLVLIDDYAHHPEEIRAAHEAVRAMHPGKQVLVVFQPHLFSRTRDFADDFAASLDLFDQVRLLDIYPAREEAMTGITSEWLLGKLQNENKKLTDKASLVEEIRNTGAPVVMMLGAGDIGEEVVKVTQAFSNEN